jgi:inorganic pyrophosphatase
MTSSFVMFSSGRRHLFPDCSGGDVVLPNVTAGTTSCPMKVPRLHPRDTESEPMNPWHDIDLGDRIERHFSVVIEIPKGSKVKYELDKGTGLLAIDRVLASAVHYPANYGFLPQTYCGDGDPLDALVLGQEPVVPLCLLRARAIGVIGIRDEARDDDKIIAIHVDDPEYADYEDIADLPPHLVRELEHFFLDYKELEGKTVAVEALRGHGPAEQVIHKAVRAYREAFGAVRGPVTGRKESPTMMIELSSEDIEVLRESLEIYLADFRREVAGTENPEMRHRLQRRQNALEGILLRLGRRAAA